MCETVGVYKKTETTETEKCGRDREGERGCIAQYIRNVCYYLIERVRVLIDIVNLEGLNFNFQLNEFEYCS